MIKINLTPEEARNTAQWANKILDSLLKREKEFPIVKKKAEIILMEFDQSKKQEEPLNLVSFLLDALGNPALQEAKRFLDSYDNNFSQLKQDINCWTVVAEQIKTQILQNEKASNKNSKSESGNQSPESPEDHY